MLKFNKDNELNSLHGFKVSVMIITIMGHRFLYFAGIPIDYPIIIEKVIWNINFYLNWVHKQ